MLQNLHLWVEKIKVFFSFKINNDRENKNGSSTLSLSVSGFLKLLEWSHWKQLLKGLFNDI